MLNLPTKFEVPNLTIYENIKGVAKCRKWGGLGWLGVTLSLIGNVMMMMMMKLPILPCAEKLELVLSTAPKT